MKSLILVLEKVYGIWSYWNNNSLIVPLSSYLTEKTFSISSLDDGCVFLKTLHEITLLYASTTFAFEASAVKTIQSSLREDFTFFHCGKSFYARYMIAV